ncbi:exoribonuclease R [Moraxella macacae 0408225]|uniref:Ribonuclease R n=1 Tax=Moraxella macacae 0408225 TaxID=1230338 RepID=L2F8I7_9GAMM|nr:ribonuclease R [Moraxella macacae]ELA09389.1 exoribonuclease R [Moraxella macacae 0408225]
MNRKTFSKKTTKNWQDPNASQEASKYVNPIPSRLLILQTLAEKGEATQHELSVIFDLDDNEYEALGNRLKAMFRDGQISRDANGGKPFIYRPINEQDTVTGVIVSNAKGFGFVVLDGMPDLFLPEEQMRWVFHGDKVKAVATQSDNRGRMNGKILQVIEHTKMQMIGKLEQDTDGFFVKLASPNAHQPIGVTEQNVREMQVKIGDPVRVELIDYPTQQEFATGKIVESLVNDNDRQLIIKTTLLNYDIPHEFSAQALQQAHAYREPVAKDYKGRVDLRDLALVTIDGEDSRDFDDAVYAEKRRGGGFRLVVAIADVSHYVTPNSALDLEAYERGTSVYFPHFVIPMLPEVLSNGLCSLNPQVDRLCMVADIVLSKAGKVTGYQFYPSIMHSQARLTYNEVNDYFANVHGKTAHAETVHGETAHAETTKPPMPTSITNNKAVKKSIDILYNLYQLLLIKRKERHAMEFETTETYIKFDETGNISEIIPRTRGDSHKLIEEMMLLANTCAADFALKHELPVLYRNHDKPDAERVGKVSDFVKHFGLSFPTENPTQVDYKRIIEATKHRPDAVSIHSVLLRSMMQANYSLANIGHFGLAYDEYSHFTSPIRRYPDLMLHRAIKAFVMGKKLPKMHYTLQEAGEQTSKTERRADEASRFVEQWLKAHYMHEHLGEQYEAVVTTVTGFGLFVTLKDLLIDGLIHISNLGADYFVYDEKAQQLIGERSGLVFGLGDVLKIKVAGVNMDTQQIDFDLVAQLSKAEFNNRGKGKTKSKSKKS